MFFREYIRKNKKIVENLVTLSQRISTTRKVKGGGGDTSILALSQQRTLLWAGHVARMHKNRLPKRLMLSWIPEPRVAGGQEMTYGRSLQRHLAHFNLPTAFTEWAPLAQVVTEPHSNLASPSCDNQEATPG